MVERLRKFLPSPEAVRANRWLRWLGPALHHHRLWHTSRRGIALGVALGVFFGFLVPIAQIPLSAAAAVVLRANVPSAIASTLVTNPFTFGPVYFAAWKVGGIVLGIDKPPPAQDDPAHEPVGPWWRALAGVGKPLIVGLAIFATGAGIGVYMLVSWAWWAHVHWRRRHRLRQRAARR